MDKCWQRYLLKKLRVIIPEHALAPPPLSPPPPPPLPIPKYPSMYKSMHKNAIDIRLY